ncbi:MAG: STAS domain-containing protein [Spirochaeta sp.]
MIEVTEDRKQRKQRVVISGKLTYAEVSEVHTRLQEVCVPKARLELDLDKVTGIDLAGYQLLLSLGRTIRERKLKFTVNPGSCRERLVKLGGFAGLPQPFAEADGWQE